jgi:uncharacterized repeat protein (TIGR01451 family)
MKKLLSIIALFFLFSICVHVGRALADVAANAQIVNQATLTFDDGSGPQTVNAAVTVTVAHVPGIPTLDAPADGAIGYTAANMLLNFNYTITANGNGPDTYTINSTIFSQTNNGGSGGLTFPASIDLGATITTGGSTVFILQVPSDGLTDAAVNGIAVNDIVVVNGEARTVSAVSDPASGTATMTLATALTAAPGAGVPILEQQGFTLTVDSGAIVTSGTDIVVTVDTSASSASGAATDQVIATYTSGSATLTKYVRNVGNPNGTTGIRSFTVNSAANNYYTGGVTGAPGETLEYLLLVENAGLGAVTGCTIDDLLPSAFVTLVSNAYGTGEVIYVDDAGVETQLSQEADADAATLAGAALTVHVGAGATAAAGGAVAALTDVFIVYRVTINN